MLTLITAATQSPVALEDAATHCRADGIADTESKLSAYLAAAVAFVADRVGLALAPAVYRLDRSEWWSATIDVPLSPVRDIASVKYINSEGDLTTVDPALYRWWRTGDGATIELLPAFTSPAVKDDTRDAVQVEIEAGFDIDDTTGSGDDPELILPRQARMAILMLTEHWFENRSAVEARDMKEVPFAVEALMAQIRVYR